MDNTEIASLDQYVPVTAMEDTKTSIVSDVFGGAVATVGDFAASTWNSLTPDSMNVDTRDLLMRISDDAVRIYDEHPDLIHAASFIGGMFIPAGLALKGTKLLRAGMKGVNWFSNAGKVEQMAKIDSFIKEGAYATAEYNKAVRSMYLRDLANTVTDNAVAELAIVGTMNAHPMMEDYIKDPVANFTTGILLGTAITAPFSHIATRMDVKNLGIKAFTSASESVLKATKAVEDTADYSAQLAQHKLNIDNLQNLIDGTVAGVSNEYSTVTKQLAESFLQTTKAAQIDAFNKMASEGIQNLPNELKTSLMNYMASDPKNFAGINSISFASAKEETSFLKQTFQSLKKTTESITGIPLTKEKILKDGSSTLVSDALIYSPTFNAFFRQKDMSGFGVAADLVDDAKNLTKGVEKNWYLIPNYDADLQVLSETSSKIDLDFLRKMKLVDEMPEDKFKEMAIHPSDAPTLNAVLTRLQKMVGEGKDISDFKVVMTEHKPNWENIEKTLLEKEIQRNVQAGGKGVAPDYFNKLQSLVTPENLNKYSLHNTGDRKLANLMDYWIKSFSNQKPVREMFMDAFMTSKGHRKYGTKEDVIDSILAGKDSPQSVAFREELMKIADSEGYVYLMRGLKQEAVGSNYVESFTTNLSKAEEFTGKSEAANAKWYRVKVSDVYGVMKDKAVGSAGHSKSVEVLVLSHTRDATEKLPIAELREAIPDSFKSLSHFGIEADSFKGIHKNNMKNIVANSYDDFLKDKPLSSTATEEQIKIHEAEATAYIKAELESYISNASEAAEVLKTNSEVKSVMAGHRDLEEALMKTKTNDIFLLAKLDTPIEVISLRTNTPVEEIEKLLSGGTLSSRARMYSDAATVEQYINQGKKSLRVNTTNSKIPVAQMRANIQRRMIDDVDSEVKKQLMFQSKSETIQDLSNFLFDKEQVTRKSMLMQALSSIVDPAAGSKFWQSSDFALRDMGIAGEIASTIGKDTTHLYNKFTSQIVKPISDTFGSVIRDPAAVVEFNMARELNASLKGYREFRAEEGMFYVQSQVEPWKKLPDGSKVRNMEPATWKGETVQLKSADNIKAFEQMHAAGREMYELQNTKRKILGLPDLPDIGFWIPAFNPRNKFISYVMDDIHGTMLLHGNTAEELKSAETAFASMMSDRSPDTWRIVRKGEDQALFNKIEGRHDPMFMSVADVNSLHGGSSASAIVPTNTNVFSELANGYEHYIHRSISDVLELHYSDVMGHLDSLSVNARSVVKGQPISDTQKTLNMVDDAGMLVKNTILGKNNLKEYVGWQNAQNGIQTSIEVAAQTIAKVMDPFVSAVRGKGKSDLEWEQLETMMNEREMFWPFKNLDQALAKEKFNVDKLSQAPNMTPRLVALSNSLSATLLLKVMELGQPLVNMLSMPILTSAAVQRQFKAEYMGAKLSENFHLSTTKAMYDGIRYLGNPEYVNKYKQLGKDRGICDPVVSEVSELIQMTRSFNPGPMQRLENILSYEKGMDISHMPLADRTAAKFVEMTSRGAVWSEKATREFAFATGISLAKKAYPDLHDAGVITFARNFVDTAIGNYNPAQRPVMFQGTIGAAMGLFQTYMVTLGQQIYRKAELRDYKNLMKMALTQSSIFGVKSLPGFNIVSEQIGEHFSDAHTDLTTGSYKALPEGMADIILYGLPSQLGPSVYSRGDIQPRLNLNPGDIEKYAAVNILKQAYTLGTDLMGTTKQIGDEGATLSFMEALSVQSISRPVARLSELFTGHSVTRNGNEIAGPQEIYSIQGVLARVFATRGLRESKAREAQYLSSMYNTIDAENRNEAMRILKNHIRSGTLTPELVSSINERYMRTGSPTGWRSAVNRAIQDTDSPGVSAVRNHLSPSSPTNLIIEDFD